MSNTPHPGGYQKVPPDHLSPRKVTILQLLAGGLNQQQVAVQLETSHQVVKNYMRVIRENLEAETTIHAVATALRKGLIK